MTVMETAIRIILDLLVRGEYAIVEKVTRSRRLAAGQMESAIREYGRTLVVPPGDWWSTVEITPIFGTEQPEFHVAAPFWTREEGRSDLTLELLLIESSDHLYETEILDIGVL